MVMVMVMGIINKKGSMSMKFTSRGEIPGDLKSRRRAFTISEVLVSAVLLVLIFGLTYEMLISAKKFWLMGDVRSDVQLNARLGFESMSRDLQSSTMDSITTLTGSLKAISMLSGYNNGSITLNSEGKMLWQKYIIYYIPSGETKLLRREVTNASVPSSTPVPLTSTELTNYCNGLGKVAAFNAGNISFATHTSSSTIDVSISTQKSLFDQNNTSVVSGTITMRN